MAANAHALARVERTGNPVTAIHREIEKARGDFDDAIGDLEIAARRLATAEHWKTAANNAFRKRPFTILAVAALTGMWLGRPKRKPR